MQHPVAVLQALRQALTKSQRSSAPAINPLADAQSFFSKGFKNLNTNLNNLNSNVKSVFQGRVGLSSLGPCTGAPPLAVLPEFPPTSVHL